MWPHNWKKIQLQAENSHVRIQLKNAFFAFFCHNVALYYVRQDFGQSIIYRFSQT